MKGIKDVQEENDDEKRQAYWNGSGQPNGGGSGQQVLDPTEFMKRARDEMGAQSVGDWKAAQDPGEIDSTIIRREIPDTPGLRGCRSQSRRHSYIKPFSL